MDDEKTVDLREIPHHQRHALIFMTFDHLQPEQGFVIVNDHDPAPLHHQFESIYGDDFGWEYLQQGPEAWQIRISRKNGGTA